MRSATPLHLMQLLVVTPMATTFAFTPLNIARTAPMDQVLHTIDGTDQQIEFAHPTKTSKSSTLLRVSTLDSVNTVGGTTTEDISSYPSRDHHQILGRKKRSTSRTTFKIRRSDSRTAAKELNKIRVANMERGFGGRIETAFETAKIKGEAAFVSFITAGYPTAEGT